jgi:antitoxin component of MazEF toxin-antitoxin module
MKLQRHFAYVYNGKRHYKNVITIPDDIVNKVGWNIGDEIRIAVQENRLLLEATHTPISKSIATAKDPYEDFRDEVKKVLESKPEGVSWTQIKTELQLSQRTPYHKWVSRMEKEIGLARERKESQTIWRLTK